MGLTCEGLSFTGDVAGMCHCNALFFLAIGSPESAMNRACLIATKLKTLSGDDVNVCNVSNRSLPYDIA